MPNADLSKKSSAIGFGCFALFLAPFFFGGLWALSMGLRNLSQGTGFTEDTIAALGVGSVFLTVSAAFGVGGLYGFRKLKEENALKAQYPDEPWLWRKDWSEGRIASNAGIGLIVLWVFAAVFSGFSVMILTQLEKIYEEEGWVVLIVGLFPLVGLLMLCSAAYRTYAFKKFGNAHCELVTNPGVVGGWFKAAVRARVPISPGDTVTARLSCIHEYTTGSGTNKSTKRDTLWQEDREIGHEGIGVDREGLSAFPVIFAIPRSCRPVEGDSGDRIVWKLQLECAVPGVDFDQSWEVPVFVTADSADTPSPAAAEWHATGASDKDFDRTSRIHITPLPDGMTLYAPPARAKKAAAMLTVFTLIWVGITIGMAVFGVPMFFPIVFGFFGLLMVYGSLSLWFGAVRTIARSGEVQVKSTILGMGGTKTIPVKELAAVHLKIGMTSGDTSYYKVVLHTTDGKNTAIAAAIRDKDEARWLQQKLADHLDLPVKEVSRRRKGANR